MANAIGSPAGTGGMGEQDNLALPESNDVIGHVEPIIGRTALREVQGYFGFPIIRKGETVTRAHAERAQSMARLFELIEATQEA